MQNEVVVYRFDRSCKDLGLPDILIKSLNLQTSRSFDVFFYTHNFAPWELTDNDHRIPKEYFASLSVSCLFALCTVEQQMEDDSLRYACVRMDCWPGVFTVDRTFGVSPPDRRQGFD